MKKLSTIFLPDEYIQYFILNKKAGLNEPALKVSLLNVKPNKIYEVWIINKWITV